MGDHRQKYKVTVNGPLVMCQAHIAEMLGVCRQSLWARLHKGQSMESIIETLMRKKERARQRSGNVTVSWTGERTQITKRDMLWERLLEILDAMSEGEVEPHLYEEAIDIVDELRVEER